MGGVLAALLVVAFLVWGVRGGWAKAREYPWTLHWPALAGALAALILFYVAWAVGYTALLEALSPVHPPRRRVGSIWARLLLGRYVPGNVLMVTARVVLGRDCGVPARCSVAASVYEQAAMLGAGGAAAVAYLASGGEGWSPALWALAVLHFALLLLHPSALEGVFRRLPPRLRRLAPPVTLAPRQLAAALAWFALTMALMGAGAALSVRGVGGTASGDVVHVGLGFLLAWAVSMLAFVFPSGLGIREGAFALVLSRHLSTPAAVSLAAASRLVMTAIELLAIGAFLALAARGRTVRGD